MTTAEDKETTPLPETGTPGPESSGEGEKKKPAHYPPGGMAYLRPSLGVTAFVLALDHLTKWLTLVYLKASPERPERMIDLWPGVFRLNYEINLGAAFSILHGQVGFLTLVSIAASIFMGWWWTRLPKGELAGRLAMAMVLGGAIGNLIDRAFRGHVVDMFDFYLINYPVFNVADSFICIGMAILVIRMLQGKI